MAKRIRVAVAGAAGRMGREVVRAVLEADDLEIVAAVDHVLTGADAGVVAGAGACGVIISESLDRALACADVLVDFTVPTSAMANLRAALEAGVSPVVGTTGLTETDLAEARALSGQVGVAAMVVPNFAIGAVLMMTFAAQAARHLPDVEIVELHHERKLDAPSGTAMLTARRVAAARRQDAAPSLVPAGAEERTAGARGAEVEGIRIHSVRLPGLVAHQEVILGGVGQTLTIRHDSTDRRGFMPGVLLAVRVVRGMEGLCIGLEPALGLAPV
ncbi:MAG: 4-hydroxy-tetrahydrodipicolinate reductase [Chthonomonadales bacterium]|nr:4-hydroxy-tetrahydrodipicolinate reductase [Chthonomonadales bacterium]